MERFKLHRGDCLETLRTLADNSVDSIVTDPPYGLSKEPDMVEVLRHWLAGDDYKHKGTGFMGKTWDSFVPGPSVWRECLRVLKPGGHLLAFFGTRTQYMGTLAIRLAGFEVRDSIAWVYGSGFPKSLDVSKAIDKTGGASVAWFGPWFRKWREGNGVTQKQVSALFPSKSGGLTGCVSNWELGLNMPTPEQFNLIRDTFGLPFESIEAAQREVVGQRTTGIGTGGGSTPIMGDGNRDITAPATEAARQWQGWGTALKPALEPITVARKPLIGTVAANVLAHGVGALNIDGCRVDNKAGGNSYNMSAVGMPQDAEGSTVAGRWPANLIHDGSDEVVALFPESNGSGKARKLKRGQRADGDGWGMADQAGELRDAGTGSAVRFFYCAKAGKKDRDEGLGHMPSSARPTMGNGIGGQPDQSKANNKNTHPTVKPTDLMAYLCRLVTPPGGVVLDPFTGSGSTGKAAMREGFRFIGCELSPEYLAIARARITHQLEAEIMRTIYCTPFDDETKQSTGPSTDSGFTTISEVVDAMGGEWLTCSDRAVVYPGLMFSDYVLRVEP